MKLTGQWNNVFGDAEKRLKPYNDIICVSVANYKPKYDTARNIYQEDKEEIEKAAKDNGFKCILRKSQVSFIKDLRQP